MNKYALTLIALLLGTVLGGCTDNQAPVPILDTNVQAYDGISFSVCGNSQSRFIREMHHLASEYGFTELENLEVERLVGNNQHRSIKDFSYVKDSHVGLWVSDVSAPDRFALLTFNSVFNSDYDYEQFRQAAMKLIKRYSCGEIGFSVVRGKPVQRTTPRPE